MKHLYEQALKEQFRKNKPHFAGKSWPEDGRLDYYGFEVTQVSEDGSNIDLNWIFKASEKYCCTMLGCHTSLKKKWWDKLRVFLEEKGENPPHITFNVKVVVEPNVLLTIPTSSEEEKGYSYTATWREGNWADD